MPQGRGRLAPRYLRKSRGLIREVALDLRRRLGADNQHVLDVSHALALLKTIVPGFKVKPVPDARFPYMDAWVNCKTVTIYVREGILEGLKYGNKRARFSIAHELGHIALGHPKSYYRRKPGAYVPPSARTAETEANAFAAEFLVPIHLVQKYATVKEIAGAFQVNRSVAERRLRELRRERQAALSQQHRDLEQSPTPGMHNVPTAVHDARTIHAEADKTASNVAFVAISFNPPMTRLYHEIIKPCLEELGFVSRRGDEVPGAGTPFDRIREAILSCRVFIAEITNLTPNVMNEIGIAQTRQIPILLICQNGCPEEVPFNIQHITRIHYENDAAGGAELRRQLAEQLRRHGAAPI